MDVISHRTAHREANDDGINSANYELVNQWRVEWARLGKARGAVMYVIVGHGVSTLRDT